MDYEKRVQELKIVLPDVPGAVGTYLPVVVVDNLAFLSGQLSRTDQGKILTGRIGENRSLEDGKQAARAAALSVLSIIRQVVGFAKFDRIVRVVGYVQTVPNFQEVALVLNGASELFAEVFGEKGVAARSAVGVASLPLGAMIELEVTLQVKGD